MPKIIHTQAPGRELDVKIARDVMNFAVVARNDESYLFTGDDYILVPNYSTSWDAAGDVLTWLSHRVGEIYIHRNLEGLWICVWSVKATKVVANSPLRTEGQTAAHAVGLAALKFVGV